MRLAGRYLRFGGAAGDGADSGAGSGAVGASGEAARAAGDASGRAAADPATNARVHAVARALFESAPDGVTDVVPSYTSLYVEFDADRLRPADLEAWLDAARDADEPADAREVEIPVRYDGADVGAVAAETGLARDEVVRRHAEPAYHVHALGFSPGFPFLGEVDAALRVPRLSAPRARVPAHAVAIAGSQTGVYPLPSPGGWRLLGTALTAVYDPHRDAPFLVSPGDVVRFAPSDGPTPPEPEPLELLPEEPTRALARVVAPGLCDLVVDAGRFRVGRFGLARSGPADARAFAHANRLLGNAWDAPALEVALRGPTLEILTDTVLAFSGQGVAPRLDGRPVPLDATFAVRRGQSLELAPTDTGVRGYLAFPGGIDSGRFLGSASVDLRGRVGRATRAGDVLGAADGRRPRAGFAVAPWRPAPRADGATVVRVVPGPQASEEALVALVRGRFRVRAADRMGVRLEGPEVPGGELLSEPTPLGAIQATPGGAPLILLHDRGSIGGYAKPAVVVPEDLPRLAQLRVGAELRFAPARGRGVVQYTNSAME